MASSKDELLNQSNLASQWVSETYRVIVNTVERTRIQNDISKNMMGRILHLVQPSCLNGGAVYARLMNEDARKRSAPMKLEDFLYFCKLFGYSTDSFNLMPNSSSNSEAEASALELASMLANEDPKLLESTANGIINNSIETGSEEKRLSLLLGYMLRNLARTMDKEIKAKDEK